MGHFSFVPSWVVQDVLVYIVAVIVVLYITKRETHPGSILLEMCCFTFFYASVYENFATVTGLYGYGRSILMIFNVPLSIPIFEYLILYSSLRLAEKMEIPTWSKPILAGFMGIVADLSLDPVAVKEIHTTIGGTIGRWTWFDVPAKASIYGEPVYNFTGWMYITGYAALFFLLGRLWHRRSNYSRVVGFLYPLLGSLASLLCLFSPLTLLFMFGSPFGAKGKFSDWVMLAVALIVPAVLLATLWRGRMKGRFSLSTDFPLSLALGGFPMVNLVFCVIGGFWNILWLVALGAIVMWLLLAMIYTAGMRLSFE